MINFIKNGWAGKLSAANAFWFGFIIPCVILMALSFLIANMAANYTAVLCALLLLIDYAICVWQIKSTWLCARNTRYSWFKWMLRGFVVWRVLAMLYMLKILYILTLTLINYR